MSQPESAPVPQAVPPALPRATPQPGPTTPLGAGLPALLSALLRSPSSIYAELRGPRPVLGALALIVLTSMLLTGLVMAGFSGGLQLLWVPIKVSFGLLLCGALCLPSLYIFTSLSGGQQSFRETAGALLMGLALISILLVGFAPVTWLFSQATSSAAFMGALHVCFFLIAAYFGIGLVRRALAIGGKAPRGTALWACLFVMVVLQMSTTLRPLVGPADGSLFHEKQFFFVHWVTGG